MITAIEIENFKAIRERVRVDLKPITLLFGPNSAGKSTVIQALHYIREILERGNFDPDRTLYGGEAVELGGFRNLVHGHDLDSQIGVRVDLDLSDVEWPEEGALAPVAGMTTDLRDRISREATSAWVALRAQWGAVVGAPQIVEYEVGLNGEFAARIRASLDRVQVGITDINFHHPLFCEVADPSDETPASSPPTSILEELYGQLFKGPIENGLGLLGLRSAVPPPDHRLSLDTEWTDEEFDERFDEYWDLAGILTQVLVGPATLLRDALRRSRYLGPLRGIPPRNYEPARSADESRWANGLAAWDSLHRNEPEFAQQVSEWMLQRLNAGYGIRKKRYVELDLDSPLGIRALSGEMLDWEDPASDFRRLPEKSRLILFEEGRDMEILPADVGVGVSQLVPVVVAALDVGSPADLVIIEQPELHVHPAIQVSLGDLFISQIANSKRTFLLETHSEHVLLRLLRRIRETAGDSLPPGAPSLKPDQVSVVYVEATSDGAKLTPLRIDASGDFVDRWPQGFFEERIDEIL